MICLIRHSCFCLAFLLAVTAFERVEAGLNRHDRDSIRQCWDGEGARVMFTKAMQDCYWMETGIQDRALNQSYRALMGKLDAKGRNGVRASQREWLKSRQRMCAKESDAGGGWEHMDGRMFWYTCFIEKTYQRIEWLDRYKPRPAN